MNVDLLITAFIYYVLYVCVISGMVWAYCMAHYPNKTPRNPIVVSLVIPAFVVYCVLAVMLYFISWIVWGKFSADQIKDACL